jgi:integrase
MKTSKRRRKDAGRIIERGSNRYLARVYLGRDSKGKRRYKSKLISGTEEQAQKWIDETKALLTLGEINIDPSTETVSQFLDRWLQVVVTPNRSTKTLEGYQWHVNHLKDGLGSCRLVDLRPEKIQAFYATLKPSTAQHCHSALRAALNVAVKWDVIKRNPALKVEPPQHSAREIPFLTAEQITELLEHAEGQYRPLFSFMVSSGVRPGEAFALRWSDLDVSMTTATIQRSVSWRESGGYQYTPLKTSRKTKKRGRSVSLPAGLAPVLREHRARQAAWFLETGIRSELVFCCETGGPLNPRNVTVRGLRPALVAAKLPLTITLYSLRHSFASVMLALGVHIKLVSEVLGHSRVDLTLNTYSHLAPGLQEDATARLDSALFPSVRTVNTANATNTANIVRSANGRERTNSANTREQVA